MTVVCIDDGTDWIWAKSLHTNAIVIYISVPFVFIEHALKQCILSSWNEYNGNIYLYLALCVFIRNRSSNICSKIIPIHNRPISRFRFFVCKIDTIKTKCIFILLFVWNTNFICCHYFHLCGRNALCFRFPTFMCHTYGTWAG